MLRGRGSCTISERPTPSSTLKTPLSPTIPVHPRNSPVTPLFPLHTQKQGGGGCFFTFHCRLSTVGCELSFPPNSFVFSHQYYYLLHYMTNNIVGAPTYCKRLTTGANTLKSGPPQKDGPYKDCELSAVVCRLALAKHAFYREIIKNVGAPTFIREKPVDVT